MESGQYAAVLMSAPSKIRALSIVSPPVPTDLFRRRSEFVDPHMSRDPGNWRRAMSFETQRTFAQKISVRCRSQQDLYLWSHKSWLHRPTSPPTNPESSLQPWYNVEALSDRCMDRLSAFIGPEIFFSGRNKIFPVLRKKKALFLLLLGQHLLGNNPCLSWWKIYNFHSSAAKRTQRLSSQVGDLRSPR